MKKNSDIARNMSKKSPDTLKNFWMSLKTDLDSLGPPIKEVFEWKKVWSDYKSSIRKTMVAQNKEMRSTGGGPNNEIVFTPLEEEVIDLVNLKNCTSGLINTISFGIPTISNRSPVSCDTEARTEIMNLEIEEILNDKENDDECNLFNPAESVHQREERAGRKRRKINHEENSYNLRDKSIKLLENQIALQEKFYGQVSNSLANFGTTYQEVSSSLKVIRKTLDKIYCEKKDQTKLIRAQLDETVRHHKEIESLARQKGKLKQDILQIELKKIEEELNNN